jgi:anti-sigma factor RsiW
MRTFEQRKRFRCRLAERLLDEYAEGAITARNRARVERHLAGCGACREQLAAVQGVVRGLNAMPREQPPAGFSARVMAAVMQAQTVPERVSMYLHRLYAAGATAAVALIIVLGLLLRPVPPQQPVAQTSAEEWRQLAAAWEEQGDVRAAVVAYDRAGTTEKESRLDAARVCEQAGFVAGAAERYADAVFGASEEVR